MSEKTKGLRQNAFCRKPFEALEKQLTSNPHITP